jgi:DNA-binding transcriptional MerR regulator
MHMKTRITVGELSRLYNLPAQTLRYYDKIDLFKPLYVDRNNNYRYYGIEQFAVLDVIILLRELGVSIEEIKAYMKQRELNSFLNLLEEKKRILSDEIKRLEERKSNIDQKIDLIMDYMDNELIGKPTLKGYGRRRLIHIATEDAIDKEKYEYGLKKLSLQIKDNTLLFKGVITLIIDRANLIKRVYNSWKGLAFIFDEDISIEESSSIITPGQYAVIFYYGSYENGSIYYKKLLEWIDENNCRIVGDAIVLNITEAAFCDREDEYITEIQIPVERC